MNTDIKSATLRFLPLVIMLLILLLAFKKGNTCRDDVTINDPSFNNQFYIGQLFFLKYRD